MFTKQIFYIILCLLVSLCESFSVHNLPRCSIRDRQCQNNLYPVIIREIGKQGIPELGIPSIDPVVLKDVSVSVLSLINLTMIDGVATGVKDCAFDKFQLDIDRGIGTQEVTCDITVKGQYSLFSDSPILKSLLGSGGVHGQGKGKVKWEKVFITWKFPFYPEKHKDGEIYLQCLYKNIKYNYDVRGKATFAAESIYVGKESVRDLVINYMNDNWKFLMRTFGKTFIDKAMEFYVDISRKFFGGIPARYFILEDLTSYLNRKL